MEPVLREGGTISQITSRLESRHGNGLRVLNDQYSRNVKWVRSVFALARKRVLDDDEGTAKLARTVKKPRPSVMQAAQISQVRRKVEFFNTRATPSSTTTAHRAAPPQHSSTTASASSAVSCPNAGNKTKPLPGMTKPSQSPITTTIEAPPLLAKAVSLTGAAEKAFTAHRPPPPPLLTASRSSPVSDYTVVFGKLNLSETLTVTKPTLPAPPTPVMAWQDPSMSASVTTSASSTPPDGPPDQKIGGAASAMDVMGQHGSLKDSTQTQRLTEKLAQLTITSKQLQQQQATIALQKKSELVVDVPQTATSQVQETDPGARESVEVLCDFRAGALKPGATSGSAMKQEVEPKAPTAAGSTPPCSSPPAEAEDASGVAEIIECNHKQPVARPAQKDAGQKGGDAAPAGGQAAAAKIWLWNGLGKKTQTQHQQPKAVNTEDSYQLSDSDTSDGNDDDGFSDEEEGPNKDKQQKKVPLWAQGGPLQVALERQFAHGAYRGQKCVDPDTIFSEIQPCNLEDIFKVKKKRYTKRTSSGNWLNDGVTPHEKATYVRTMGFAERVQTRR